MKDSPAIRWGILLLISIVMAANYYFYDVLSPLKSELQNHLGFSSSDYGWVTGFYSFPNTFLLMAIFGGFILDKIGIRITGTMFTLLMVLGAYVTYYATTNYFNQGGFCYQFFGSFLKSFTPQVKMMALGMLLFGLGAETSIVCISKIIVKWFKGREIAFAFGINLGIARIGTALALFIGPRLVNPNWTSPVWLAVCLITISFIAFLFYLFFDIKLDKQLTKFEISDPEEKFQFKDLYNLITNRPFIYITILCVAFYSAVFPFLKYAPDFFHNKWGVPNTTAGAIASWLPFGTVLFTPIFGSLVDKKGKSATLMILGSIVLVLVHLCFAITKFNPYILITLLGIALSLVPAAMWPSVAKIVNVNKIGTAYGIMFSTQNLGLFAVPIIAGYIIDYTNAGITAEMLKNGSVLNYTPTMIMFSIFGFIGLIFAFLLRRNDKKSGYGLELQSNESGKS